jgi:hypothetical protein
MIVLEMGRLLTRLICEYAAIIFVLYSHLQGQPAVSEVPDARLNLLMLLKGNRSVRTGRK